LTVNAGTVEPGVEGGIATLNITGNCALGANSELDLDVEVGAGLILGYDQLAVNTAGGGTVTLNGGSLNVNILHSNPFDYPDDGQTTNILLYRSVSGDFGAPPPAYPGGFWLPNKTATTYQLIADS
jgi:hypothetical protein